jgi:hypothetical protein
LKSTTTKGVFGAAALILSMSCCWRPGKSISLREAASPLCPRLSPRARTIWSALVAASTAAWNPASDPHSSAGVLAGGSLSRMVQPWLNVVFGFCAVMPASSETASSSLP